MFRQLAVLQRLQWKRLATISTDILLEKGDIIKDIDNREGVAIEELITYFNKPQQGWGSGTC